MFCTPTTGRASTRPAPSASATELSSTRSAMPDCLPTGRRAAGWTHFPPRTSPPTELQANVGRTLLYAAFDLDVGHPHHERLRTGEEARAYIRKIKTLKAADKSVRPTRP